MPIRHATLLLAFAAAILLPRWAAAGGELVDTSSNPVARTDDQVGTGSEPQGRPRPAAAASAAKKAAKPRPTAPCQQGPAPHKATAGGTGCARPQAAESKRREDGAAAVPGASR